jgi:hypothetical protein
MMLGANIEDDKVLLSVKAEAAVMFVDHAKARSWRRRTDR